MKQYCARDGNIWLMIRSNCKHALIVFMFSVYNTIGEGSGWDGGPINNESNRLVDVQDFYLFNWVLKVNRVIGHQNPKIRQKNTIFKYFLVPFSFHSLSRSFLALDLSVFSSNWNSTAIQNTNHCHFIKNKTMRKRPNPTNIPYWKRIFASTNGK